MSVYYIVGVGMTKFGRHSDRTLSQMTQCALDIALDDAQCQLESLQSVFYSGSTNGYLQGQEFVSGQIILNSAGLQGVPVVNVENGCASGGTAFNLALQSVKSGSCDIALAIGAEKMNIADRAKMFAVFDGAWDVGNSTGNRQRLIELGEGPPVVVRRGQEFSQYGTDPSRFDVVGRMYRAGVRVEF